MRIRIRQNIATLAMLTAFLPMLLLSSVHVHEVETQVDTECDSCHNHQPHAGHLTGNTGSSHDCLLCAFASLQYHAEECADIVRPTQNLCVLVCYYYADYQPQILCNSSPRAPPVI